MASSLPDNVNTDASVHSEQTGHPDNSPSTSASETVGNETNNPVGDDTITEDVDPGTVQESDCDAYRIRELSESHFGDEESNADHELGDTEREGPYFYSDDDDEDELENGILTDPEPNAEDLFHIDSDPVSPITTGANGHREESPYYYSDITEEGNNNEVRINGIQSGQGNSEVEDPHPDTDMSEGHSSHDYTLAPLEGHEGGGIPNLTNNNDQPFAIINSPIHIGEIPANHRSVMFPGREADENFFGHIGQGPPNTGSLATEARARLSSNRDTYVEYRPAEAPFAQTFTGRPVMQGRNLVPTSQPFSRPGGFYMDPVDWEDDEERIRLATINALAARLGPHAVDTRNSAVEKENIPPGRTSSPSSPEPAPRQRQPSPNRYSHEGTEEYRPHSFGPLRPVPSYPRPSTNVDSNPPLTSAHIWYRSIAPDIQNIPEDMALVTGAVRPIHEPHADGV